MTILSIYQTRLNPANEAGFGDSAIVPGGSLSSREIFNLYSRGGQVDSVLSSQSETEFREVTEIKDPLVARQYVLDLQHQYIADVQQQHHLQQQQQQQQQQLQQQQQQQLQQTSAPPGAS